jgi:ectoine hydroxylase-related dioxygenase (phytanoyl-CoA dioxygenase family)
MPAIAALPQLFSCGHPLDESHVALMRETSHTLAADALHERMDEDGHLLLRGLLDVEKVMAARRRVLEQLDAAGQLDADAPLMDGKFRAGAEMYFFRPELAQKNNVELQELLYSPAGQLMQFFKRFLGGEVRHYDFTWLRCIPKGPGTASHCDIVYMGRGTRKLYTAWVPLGKANFETGGLCVLEGSHKNERLQRTYGRRDVDLYCENHPGDKALTAHGTNGWLSDDPNKIRRQLGNRWLVAEYEPGDAVVFCMDLVHGGLDNHSDRLRLSSDSRYQLASEPIDERWIGDDPPGHGAAGKRGRIC